MNTKALKEKILDLAIHGNLTKDFRTSNIEGKSLPPGAHDVTPTPPSLRGAAPKTPQKQTATQLLEQIRAEKEAQIASGNRKRDKNDSYIYKQGDTYYEKFLTTGIQNDITDEIPFDIPDSWAWCRLGEISSEILYGVSESAKTEGKYKLLRITDIQNNSVNWNNVPFTDFDEKKASSYLLKDGDLVFARTGATVGKSYLIKELPTTAIYASYLIRVRVNSIMQSEFLKVFFDSPIYWNQIIDKSSGIGQPNVNGTKLSNLLITLPPLDEQTDIVARIQKIFEQIDTLDTNKNDLLNAIKNAKSKILDIAIHAKLVPQNKDDTSASTLLEQIRAEKEAQIASGNRKRDKNDSYIYKQVDTYYEKFLATNTQKDITDEIPYDIPDSWAWCRLGEISSEILYGVSESAKSEGKFKLLRITDIQNNSVNWDNVPFTDFDEKKASSYLLKDGDLVFARTGATVGKSYLIKELPTTAIYASYLIRVRVNSIMQSDFLKVFFDSPIYWNQIIDKSSGIGQPNVNGTKLSNLLITLPPLDEQQRIVSKIEQIFATLDTIQSCLE